MGSDSNEAAVRWPALIVSVSVVLATSLALAYAAVLASTLVLPGGLDSAFEDFDELFGRTFLAVAIAGLALILLRQGIWGELREGPYWVRVLVGAFVIGMAASLLDPFNSISQENNVIRYWTAGFLVWSGIALVAASIIRPHPIWHRILAAALALLVIVAAADELFQFHEAFGNSMSGEVLSEAPVGAQDFLTLLVAVTGFLVATAGYLTIHFLDRYPKLRLKAAPRLAAQLFIAACVVFLCAMLLDSFDGYLERGVNTVLSAVLGNDSGVYSFLDSQNLIIRASNCLEEFMELGTATLLVSCGMVLLQERNDGIHGA